MHLEKKELYVQPALVKHELLRDITASLSCGNHPILDSFRPRCN